MVQLGQHPASLGTARQFVSRCWNTNSRISFWWWYSLVTAATEEWTGAGAPLTQTITVS
jgi:hypothetical protein